MGCGCGGNKFSGGGAGSRRSGGISVPVSKPGGSTKVVLSPEVKTDRPTGAVPLRRTQV